MKGRGKGRGKEGVRTDVVTYFSDCCFFLFSSGKVEVKEEVKREFVLTLLPIFLIVAFSIHHLSYLLNYWSFLVVALEIDRSRD